MKFKVNIPSIKGVDLTISIAIKQPTKRAAKGLNLRGAKGRRARHDNYQHGSGHQGESWPSMRPALNTRDLIAESLEAGLLNLNPVKLRDTRVSEPRPAYTTQSRGFPCPPAQFDRAGRSVIYVEGCDAWSLRVRR